MFSGVCTDADQWNCMEFHWKTKKKKKEYRLTKTQYTIKHNNLIHEITWF